MAIRQQKVNIWEHLTDALAMLTSLLYYVLHSPWFITLDVQSHKYCLYLHASSFLSFCSTSRRVVFTKRLDWTPLTLKLPEVF